MTNWRCSALVVCPYYLRENDAFIVCESVLEGVEQSLHFLGRGDKIAWQRNVCCSWGYRTACPYAAMLEERYRREEDDG